MGELQTLFLYNAVQYSYEKHYVLDRYLCIDNRKHGGIKRIITFKSYLSLHTSYRSTGIIDWISNIWTIIGFGCLANQSLWCFSLINLRNHFYLVTFSFRDCAEVLQPNTTLCITLLSIAEVYTFLNRPKQWRQSSKLHASTKWL